MKSSTYVLSIVTVILLGMESALPQGSSLTQPIQAEERDALFPSADMIELGRAVAETACASCHGMDGISDSKGKPHLAGQRVLYLYRVLQAYQSGELPDDFSRHRGFLNDKALLSAVVYYANLTPVQKTNIPEVTAQADSTAQANVTEEDPFLGIRDAMKKCVKCHDGTGNSSGSGTPSLTGQDPEYFVTSMLSYLDGSRSHKLMKKLVGRLDEATIKEMGVFYGVQEPLKTETQGEGDANVGRRLAEDCKNCHGDDGNVKKASIPTLAGQDARYFVKAMKQYKDGKRLHEKMFEAVEELSEQDMTDLATYYAAEEPRQRDVRMPLKSTEWIARCERCHGIDGNSTDPRFPMLAGQDETYLKKVLQAAAAGKRANLTMNAMASPLSKLDIERIASYFASQQPKTVVYVQLPHEDYEPD